MSANVTCVPNPEYEPDSLPLPNILIINFIKIIFVFGIGPFIFMHYNILIEKIKL